MTQASITALIGSKLVNPIEFNIDYTLDAYAEFSLSVPADEIDIREIRGKDIEIYLDNDFFVSGIIIERPIFNISDKKNKIQIRALDEMGRLSCIRAKSNSHYQDQLIITILNDLLQFAPSFTLDITNYPNALTDVTTIDLTSKETLWAQISEVVKSIPDLHIRYGGMVSNQHVLEIGNFDNLLYSLQEGVNLVSLQLEPDEQRVYKIVESFGGWSTDERITLQNAINDGRALIHPDYVQFPIVYDALTDTFYVENLEVDGCETTKKFELAKTKRENAPTAAERNEAGYALWLKSVRFLKQNQSFESYSGSVLRKEKMLLGERVHVVASVYEHYYNITTGTKEKAKVFEVNNDFKITKIGTKLENVNYIDKESHIDNGHVFIWDFQITNGSDAIKYDHDLEMYERLEKPDDVPTANGLQISPLTPISVTHSGLQASDCGGSGGITNGKIFSFDFDAALSGNIPSWANQVNFIFQTSIPSNILYYIDTYNPSDLVNPIELCVAPSNGDWDTLANSDTIEVTILVYFT